MVFIRFSIFWVIIGTLCFAESFAQEADESTAPWDYRDPRYAYDLATVERNHFNQDVQMLKYGQTGAYPGPDLEFIFRYFPNHHSALHVMSTLWRRHRNTRGGVPPGLSPNRDASFYFDRAIEFAPDDGIVRMLYGMHLYSVGQSNRALLEYEYALQLAPDSPEVHYNAGLYFLSTGAYDTAVVHARLAYKSGYPLPGLKRKLIEIEAWDGQIE